MAGPPTVSVVLPVWNCERFLREAMESVLCQRFSQLELLVIDDGSTDDSAAIALDIAACDPRVTVLREQHRGIVHALNVGLQAARGMYVARMDADDVCHAERLGRQVSYLDAHPDCVAVGSDVEVIDEHGEPIGAIRFPSGHPEIVDALLDGATRAVAHPTVMMRREHVLRAGGYRASCFPSEDLDLWVRLLAWGTIANISEPLLRYRRHGTTVGARENLRQQLTGAAILAFERTRRGLRRLRPRLASSHWNPMASYHFECVRIALISGNRAAALRHARATIRRSPDWWRPYAAFAVAALPDRPFTLVMKCYERLRALRRWPASVKT